MGYHNAAEARESVAGRFATQPFLDAVLPKGSSKAPDISPFCHHLAVARCNAQKKTLRPRFQAATAAAAGTTSRAAAVAIQQHTEVRRGNWGWKSV